MIGARIIQIFELHTGFLISARKFSRVLDRRRNFSDGFFTAQKLSIGEMGFTTVLIF